MPPKGWFSKKGIEENFVGGGEATYYVSFVQIMRQKSESPTAASVTGNRRGFHNVEKFFVGLLLSGQLVDREVQIFQFTATLVGRNVCMAMSKS